MTPGPCDQAHGVVYGALFVFDVEDFVLADRFGPLVVNNLSIAGMNAADAMMAGRLGADTLAAVAVGSGLAGASAAASLAELGYQVEAFTFHDSPRRAHSIAAQGGINAAKNYQGDGDSIFRLFYDTAKTKFSASVISYRPVTAVGLALCAVGFGLMGNSWLVVGRLPSATGTQPKKCGLWNGRWPEIGPCASPGRA